MTRTQTHNFQTLHQRKRNATRRKSVGNIGKMTRQTHHQAAILIRPTTVIKYASDARGRATGKKSDQIMRTFNRKDADDSV